MIHRHVCNGDISLWQQTRQIYNNQIKLSHTLLAYFCPACFRRSLLPYQDHLSVLNYWKPLRWQHRGKWTPIHNGLGWQSQLLFDLSVPLTDPPKVNEHQTFMQRQLWMGKPGIGSTRSRAATIHFFPSALYCDLIVARHVHAIFRSAWRKIIVIKKWHKRARWRFISWTLVSIITSNDTAAWDYLHISGTSNKSGQWNLHR